MRIYTRGSETSEVSEREPLQFGFFEDGHHGLEMGLVGVDTENPIRGSLFEGKVLVDVEIRLIGTAENLSGVLAGEAHGTVAAAAVDNHNFVGPPKTRKGALDILLFVVGYYTG